MLRKALTVSNCYSQDHFLKQFSLKNKLFIFLGISIRS